MSVGTGVSVGVRVFVSVGRSVAVGVDVGVSVGAEVLVGVAVNVLVDSAVGVRVGVFAAAPHALPSSFNVMSCVVAPLSSFTTILSGVVKAGPPTPSVKMLYVTPLTVVVASDTCHVPAAILLNVKLPFTSAVPCRVVPSAVFFKVTVAPGATADSGVVKHPPVCI